MKRLNLLFIVLLFVSASATSAMQATTTQPMPSRTLNYHPDGRDIVCRDGQNRYTRALYGGYTDFRVETSDRPIFATYRSRHCRNIRIDFATARVSRELMPMGEHYGRPAASGVAGSYNDRTFEKGAGIILDMPLNKEKTLKELTLRTLSNDVVIGLMGITLQRSE